MGSQAMNRQSPSYSKPCNVGTGADVARRQPPFPASVVDNHQHADVPVPLRRYIRTGPGTWQPIDVAVTRVCRRFVLRGVT